MNIGDENENNTFNDIHVIPFFTQSIIRSKFLQL